MPMPLVDPNFARDQKLFFDLRSKQITAETKGNPSNYVLYKRKHYPLSEAMCFVQFKEKIYAVIKVDPTETANTDKHLKKVGEVYQNRKSENDLSDQPEENLLIAYPVYRKGFSRQYLVETLENKSVLYPMLEIRKGIG